jgi:putative acetyltransferase
MTAIDDIRVRVMRPDEFDAMRAVSVAAFGDDESIGELLDALRESWAWHDELCFVAVRGDDVVGQVLYTSAIVDAPDRLLDVLVLSPVGVSPQLQRSGIGSRLIAESLAVLRTRDEPLVFLEGHPGYYPRFGFRRGDELGFTRPSVRIPPAAFMVYPLQPFDPSLTGALVYPDLWWRLDAVGLRP